MSKYFLSCLIGVGLLLFCIAGTKLAVADPTNHPAVSQWLETEALPKEIFGGQALISPDQRKMFLIGGKTSEGKIANVLSANILITGPVQGWRDDSSIPVPVYLHAMAMTAANAYVIGGYDDYIRYSNIWQAAWINGNLGPWKKIGDYSLKIVHHSAVAAGNSLFVLGGLNERNELLDEVKYARINEADGTLSLPFTQTIALPRPLARFSAVAYQDYIYVVGGYDGNDAQSEVYYAKVSSTGPLNHWSATTSLPHSVYYHAATVQKNKLLVFGGKKNTEAYQQVYMALINGTDGTLGQWIELPALPESLFRLAAVTASEESMHILYVLGGGHDERQRNKVYYSFLRPDTYLPIIYR